MIHAWLRALCCCAGFVSTIFAVPASAQVADSGIITVVSRTQIALSGHAAHLGFQLTAVVLEDSGWTSQQAIDGLTAALTLLRQCAIGASALTLLQVRTTLQFRDLYTPASRRVAAALALPRPAIFFAAQSRNRPAFDAEAFGAGNTRTRPELRDTVWVTRAAADLPQTIAHELFHVLANSGAHSEDPDNLMHADTAPQRTRLEPEQCAALIRSGLESGLLTSQ